MQYAFNAINRDEIKLLKLPVSQPCYWYIRHFYHRILIILRVKNRLLEEVYFVKFDKKNFNKELLVHVGSKDLAMKKIYSIVTPSSY